MKRMNFFNRFPVCFKNIGDRNNVVMSVIIDFNMEKYSFIQYVTNIYKCNKSVIQP